MTACETISGDEASPRNKVKFLCSYGGKIMARPGDMNLKYVGGETRVVAVPRNISFSELMKKLNNLVEGGDVILKYQIIPEELDALVTVRNDEDLKHMVDEYFRLESEGTPKLRAFLFPLTPIILENHMSPVVEPHAVEQRYLEAVNGIVRQPSYTSSGSGRLTPINATRPNFSFSACSSPDSPSPDAKTVDSSSSPLEPPSLNACRSNSNNILKKMAKVQSSPSLYNLGTQLQTQSNHQVYNQSPHYYYQQQPQPQIFSVQSPSPKPPLDFRMERLPSGPQDFGWGAMGHGYGPINHCYSVGRHNWGNGCCRRGCYDYDHDSLVLGHGSPNLAKGGSVPASGRPERVGSPSPRNPIWE